MSEGFVFSEELAVAQVALIPLLMGVIGVIKRAGALIPFGVGQKIEELPGDVWFVLSVLLGSVVQVLYYFAFVGTPETFATWFTLVVIGAAFGLASGKAYDEQKVRRNGE